MLMPRHVSYSRGMRVWVPSRVEIIQCGSGNSGAGVFIFAQNSTSGIKRDAESSGLMPEPPSHRSVPHLRLGMAL